MIVYRGTPIKNPLVEKGKYVSPWLERSASYSRYPNNGAANEIGYVYELEVPEFDVDWDERDDGCPQGKLKINVIAKRVAVCDVPLDIRQRQSPIRIKIDKIVWANGKDIEWLPTDNY